jgi:hypothetical protein
MVSSKVVAESAKAATASRSTRATAFFSIWKQERKSEGEDQATWSRKRRVDPRKRRKHNMGMILLITTVCENLKAAYLVLSAKNYR